MKFNLILEDGSILTNCTVLSARGVAKNRKDVWSAFKYEGRVTIKNDKFFNLQVKSRDLYVIEEILNIEEVVA